MLQLLIQLLLLAVMAFAIWLAKRILNRAGYSGWWAITILIPVVNLIMIWIFAFFRWPAIKTKDPALAEAPDEMFQQAWNELKENRTDEAIWARAFAIAGDNEQKTRSLYIRERVKKLMTAEKEKA